MPNFPVNFKNTQKQAEVNLDSFRQMVNYDNTKNKGYVRMSLGSDGKVHLEKIRLFDTFWG